MGERAPVEQFVAPPQAPSIEPVAGLGPEVEWIVDCDGLEEPGTRLRR